MKTNLDGGYLISEKVGEGSPILFIHGYPLSRKIWEPQTQVLGDQSTVITLDLRGHGESFEFDGAYSMEMLADDCYQVLKDQSIDLPTVICGHSMGGYVTFALYRIYPEIFKGMILNSTRAGADSPEGKTGRDASIKAALEGGAKAIADAMLPKILSSATSKSQPELVNEVRSIMAGTSVSGIVGALQAMRERPDSTPMLSSISCPVLIIHGEDDQLIPIKEAELMQQGIPNSKLVKISKAGHLPSLEQPDQFNSVVREFLSSLG